MLVDLGYEVVEAISAEQALSLLGTGFEPNLVVTDHLMPGKSGAQLARNLKADRPALPVLIVSDYAEADGIRPKFHPIDGSISVTRNWLRAWLF